MISSNDSDNPRSYNSNELHPKLPRIAEKQTVISGRVYRFGSKQACRQRSPGSTNTVYSYHIKRIIVTELWL